jgi:hypothetical protein
MSAGLELPELGKSEPLANLVEAVIRRRRGAAAPPAVSTHAFWPAAFFGLDRARVFATAAPEAQAAILERCGRDLIEEAFYIEKSGVAFAAKMILLAESIDERKLYAMFGADEAAHLDGVGRYYGARAAQPAANPFLALLAELIEDGDRVSLQLVIQVVLEGWGLTHYRAIRNSCTSDSLRAVFSSILFDEAAHHGSGVLLVGERRPSAASTERIIATMTRFLAMVQVGPLGVVGAVESVLGPLAALERQRLFDELDGERHSAERLCHLRQLMEKAPGVSDIVACLERAGSFQPLVTQESSCLPRS